MIDFLKKELLSAKSWTERVLDKVDENDWKTTPKALKTNINWQIGHLTISSYFHNILCVQGSDDIVKAKFNPRQYSVWYGMGSKPIDDLSKKPERDEMLNNMALVDQRTLEILENLNQEKLMEATIMDNPVANNKLEALFWSVKHRMYHNGQMAVIAKAMMS